jgi:hypothetical protein
MPGTTLYRVLMIAQPTPTCAFWKQMGKDDRFSSIDAATAFAETLKGRRRQVVVSRLINNQWEHEIVAEWGFVKIKGKTFSKRIK